MTTWWVCYTNRFNRYECVDICASEQTGKESRDKFIDFHKRDPEPTDYFLIKVERVK